LVICLGRLKPPVIKYDGGFIFKKPDPKVIGQIAQPIKEGKADAEFGFRMMKGGALDILFINLP